ncbi:hypothetical protein KUTeg_012172 [Tegillarca granosa]|uniref:Cilium assembly protein DZIP1 N-terminal domain-containing protein n=1 Tax=Tegillarca granosa TaxID=220873 RepID=A0ABQ9F209_TEGGR|nr:hypothetical protein KUTeg_012172 [Tegillarca granosa]
MDREAQAQFVEHMPVYFNYTVNFPIRNPTPVTCVVKMATQFMYSQMPGPYVSGGGGSVGGPYSYPAGMNGYQNGYSSKGTNGKNFAFRKRYEKVDWRKIASVDVDQISRTLDFNALQDNILNITFCNIEAELDLRMVDPNFVKLFKLAQLTIEYLLHSQEYLTGIVSTSEDKVKKAQEDLVVIISAHFVPKAFLNNSFLQSHLNRRHGDYSGKAASVPVGGADNNVNQELLAELKEIKERLQFTESQLQREKQKSLTRELVLNDDEKERSAEEKEEIVKVKEMFMKELHEVNEKFQSSERMRTEMEMNYGKRSNLGELQDDIDVEKELLRQQREEVAFENVETSMNTKYNKQEKKYQKKIQQMSQNYAEDIRKKSREKEELLKEEQIIAQAAAAAAASRTTPRSPKRPGDTSTKVMSMEPLDDDEDTTELGTGTGTGSMLTGRQSLHSTLGNSGELTLRTTQFLDELRKNPTLKIMRDELESLLHTHLDKIGH